MLDTEPRFSILCELHDLCGVVPIVCPVRSTVVVVGLCEDKDVITTTEGVLENRSRTKIDIGVAAGGLIGGGTIEVPDTELTDVGDLFGDGLQGWWSVKRTWERGMNQRWSWSGDRHHRRSRHLKEI